MHVNTLVELAITNGHPRVSNDISLSLSLPQAWDTSSSDDMSVLSVVGGEGVSPATDVFYICQQYSLVFVLDITPTMIQVVYSHRRSTHTHSHTFPLIQQSCAEQQDSTGEAE